jgi:hypothetical protein
MNYLPSAIVEGKSLRYLLISLVIPNQTRLFTADAVSMYTNIELEHAFKIIKDWMESLPPQELFFEFRPAVQDAIIDALKLVTRHNLMQFGTTYSIQEIGTAMGTSCAVIFANLYYGWHEKQSILPKYLRSPLATSTIAKKKPLYTMHILLMTSLVSGWELILNLKSMQRTYLLGSLSGMFQNCQSLLTSLT